MAAAGVTAAPTAAGGQRTADGSAAEVRAALAIGVAWGWIEQPEAILATVDRLMALLWGLTHVKRVCGLDGVTHVSLRDGRKASDA